MTQMIDIGNADIAVEVLTGLDRSNESAGDLRNAAVSDWLQDILHQLGVMRETPKGVDEQRHGTWDRDSERYEDGQLYHTCGVVCSVGVS